MVSSILDSNTAAVTMNRTYIVIQFYCFMMLCVLSSQSSAIMEGISIKDLTKASDVVIEGEVIDSKAYWSSHR